MKNNYTNNANKLPSESKDLNKIHVVNKKLQENNNEKLVNYTRDFEMIEKLSAGDQIRTIHIRFRNIDDSESYINSTDEGYDFQWLYL